MAHGLKGDNQNIQGVIFQRAVEFYRGTFFCGDKWDDEAKRLIFQKIILYKCLQGGRGVYRGPQTISTYIHTYTHAPRDGCTDFLKL